MNTNIDPMQPLGPLTMMNREEAAKQLSDSPTLIHLYQISYVEKGKDDDKLNRSYHWLSTGMETRHRQLQERFGPRYDIFDVRPCNDEEMIQQTGAL